MVLRCPVIKSQHKRRNFDKHIYSNRIIFGSLVRFFFFAGIQSGNIVTSHWRRHTDDPSWFQAQKRLASPLQLERIQDYGTVCLYSNKLNF